MSKVTNIYLIIEVVAFLITGNVVSGTRFNQRTATASKAARIQATSSKASAGGFSMSHLAAGYGNVGSSSSKRVRDSGTSKTQKTASDKKTKKSGGDGFTVSDFLDADGEQLLKKAGQKAFNKYANHLEKKQLSGKQLNKFEKGIKKMDKVTKKFDVVQKVTDSITKKIHKMPGGKTLTKVLELPSKIDKGITKYVKKGGQKVFSHGKKLAQHIGSKMKPGGKALAKGMVKVATKAAAGTAKAAAAAAKAAAAGAKAAAAAAKAAAAAVKALLLLLG